LEEEALSEQKVERRHYGPDRRKPDPMAAREHPTAHVPRLITTHQVKHKVHGTGAIGHFNNRLAVVITRSVGTMWAAYTFTLIAIVGAVALITSNAFLTLLVALVSQTFLQLVLLPVIIVGQNVISASQDARAEADHETLTALHAMNVRQLQILEQQERILRLLEERAPARG
jgi:hypothetical protein